VQQTLIAFNTRRDSSKSAGEYDFALRPNESYRPVPKLSVSDLQRMVSSPAIIWMKRYLGVEAPEDAANPWTATTGKWVHRLAGEYYRSPGRKDFLGVSVLNKDRQAHPACRGRTLCGASASLRLVRQSRP
jgi:hypothetical protein